MVNLYTSELQARSQGGSRGFGRTPLVA